MLQETIDHIFVVDPDTDGGLIRLDRASGLLVFYGAVMPWGSQLDSLRKATLGMILKGHQVNFRGLETWEFYRRRDNLAARVTGEHLAHAHPDENQDPDLAQPRRANLEIVNVTDASLLAWLSATTIDICNMAQPDALLDTDWGDLLLDVEYADCVYVDGVRVSSRQLGVFEFGYHYKPSQGLVSSDLELDTDDIEAELRCQLWMDITTYNEDIVNFMVTIMRTRPWAPDVRGFEDNLERGKVELIRDYMLEECEGLILCNAMVFPSIPCLPDAGQTTRG